MMKIKGRKKGRGRRSTHLGTDWLGFELEFIMGIMNKDYSFSLGRTYGYVRAKIDRIGFGI